jgi:hypothetical protein
MEYRFEHIEVELPDDEWIEELARMFAEIIYREMINDTVEEVPPVIQR